MIFISVIIITLMSYFHYNQLPIYDIDLAVKFILNEQKNNDFDAVSEALGYKPTDKLLIIHADDLGLCESVNSEHHYYINYFQNHFIKRVKKIFNWFRFVRWN